MAAGARTGSLLAKARVVANFSKSATAKAFMAVIEQAVDVKLDSAALSAKLDMCNVNVSLE
jgi:hypothetical protein